MPTAQPLTGALRTAVHRLLPLPKLTLSDGALYEMVSKVFGSMTAGKEFDRPLWRASNTSQIVYMEETRSQPFEHTTFLLHPFLHEVGLYINFELFAGRVRADIEITEDELLRIVPLLRTSVAQESALWPPHERVQILPHLVFGEGFVTGIGYRGVATIKDVMRVSFRSLQRCRRRRSWTQDRYRMGDEVLFSFLKNYGAYYSEPRIDMFEVSLRAFEDDIDDKYDAFRARKAKEWERFSSISVTVLLPTALPTTFYTYN